MKKTLILLFLSSIVLYAKGQDTISITKEDIAGRWMSTQIIEGGSVKMIESYPDTYIFKDDMMFHKGEASEGVILFNITGKYAVEGNSVTITYRDYINRKTSKQDAKKLIFDVLSMSGNEMLVSVKDYDYEYKMLLKR